LADRAEARAEQALEATRPPEPPGSRVVRHAISEQDARAAKAVAAFLRSAADVTPDKRLVVGAREVQTAPARWRRPATTGWEYDYVDAHCVFSQTNFDTGIESHDHKRQHVYVLKSGEVWLEEDFPRAHEPEYLPPPWRTILRVAETSDSRNGYEAHPASPSSRIVRRWTRVPDATRSQLPFIYRTRDPARLGYRDSYVDAVSDRQGGYTPRHFMLDPGPGDGVYHLTDQQLVEAIQRTTDWFVHRLAAYLDTPRV
jgi:hypothetical protein